MKEVMMNKQTFEAIRDLYKEYRCLYKKLWNFENIDAVLEEFRDADIRPGERWRFCLIDSKGLFEPGNTRLNRLDENEDLETFPRPTCEIKTSYP
jgi:hypothetical protein